MIKLRTSSARETQEFAAALSEGVEEGDMILLIGEIGAGKTTFTKGFGVGLGVTEPITSPTFVLMHTYQGRIPLHHIDIYRLEHLQEVIDLGLVELLDEGGIALVEWGDLASPVLPREVLEVSLAVDDQDLDARHITINGIGSQWQQREVQLTEKVTKWVLQ